MPHPDCFIPWERLGTHCIGGWVGPRAVLDRCGNPHPHRNSIPGPSSPLQITILTTVSWPTYVCKISLTLDFHVLERKQKFNDKCELLYQVKEYNMFIAVPMMCGVSTWKIKHGISKLQQR